jgi:GTP pyrophosphokinase
LLWQNSLIYNNKRGENMPLTFEELLKNIKKYISKKSELETIKKAYEFAALKHYGQKRLTGEDYIIHPLSVAYILSFIKADSET